MLLVAQERGIERAIIVPGRELWLPSHNPHRRRHPVIRPPFRRRPALGALVTPGVGLTQGNADGDTTIAVTLVGTTAGDSVLVLVIWGGTTTTFNSVDIGGQAGTVRPTTLGSSGTLGSLQFATLDSLSSGGDKVITATMSANVAAGSGLIVAWSFSGTNTSGVFDKGNTAAATGLPSLSLTTVADNCHIIGAVIVLNGGSTAGANYTLADLTDKDFFNTSERDTDFDAGTAGAKTVNFATVNDTYVLSAIALKPAAGGASSRTPAPTPRLIQTDRVQVSGAGVQAFAPRKVQVYPSPASFDFPVQNVPPLGQATPEVMRLRPFRAAPFLARVVPMPSTVLTAAAVLSATGDATATFVGAAQDNSVLAATGDATATFTGASKAAAVLSAAGDATATFTGAATAASVLSAAADATASFTGAAKANSTLSAPGDATGSFTGAALARGVLSAPGDSSLSFVGRADAAAVWNASGDASAAWIGSTGGNVLSASGDSSGIFVGAELAASVLAAAGDSSVLWSGTFTVPGGDELGARAPMRGKAKARKPPKQRRPIYRHPEEVERERRMLEEYLESLETKARPASEEPVRPGESQEAPTRRAEPVAPRLSDVMARLASAQQLALIASAERVAKEDRAKAQKEHKRRRTAAIAVLMMSH